jgi:hypothetical protein
MCGARGACTEAASLAFAQHKGTGKAKQNVNGRFYFCQKKSKKVLG